ncbi:MULTISPECIES: hypothetical protein [Paenibacillus]|uniref:Uncharacterized protein n=2 Tax=Paenibacillus TaxID=44249 RepID=A0ABX2Z4I3_PAEPO|nr:MULTISPECIES: hypothetical protein [Paenibacillus]MDR6777003.1 hypothetical protein [Paenibacillus peoriae]ODA06099.1 hypothetical protein A7312_17605 [Paenibacillus polymyxa]OME71756.1 hypothetical protein BK119_09090 [Paenibacillus peoriae]
MGTDIWFFVEKRYFRDECEQIDGTWRKIKKSKQELNDTATWLSVDKWTVNPYYYLYPEHKTSKLKPSDPYEFYSGDRNYDLFSILSNTRNDHNLKFISLPRGLPVDISPELSEVAFEDKDDFYDHSWLLLKDLINFKWDENYYCDQFMEYRNIMNTCSNFINETIPKLLKLGNAEDVRVIFWFG